MGFIKFHLFVTGRAYLSKTITSVHNALGDHDINALLYNDLNKNR